MNVIRAPALGYLVSGAADDGGWVHNQGPTLYPTSTMAAADGWAHNCLFDASFTLTPSPTGTTQDALWVTAGDEYGSCHGSPSWCGLHSWVGVSRDGGATFKDTNWDNVYGPTAGGGGQANPYRVQVHPRDGSQAVVVARKGVPIGFTRDFGVTWANSTLAPGGEVLWSVGEQGNFWFAQPLARENNDNSSSGSGTDFTLYFYNGTSSVFTSRDSGATFTTTFTGFPSWDTPLFSIATPPKGASAPGDLWVFAGWKLYHSVNGGGNFSQVWQFYSAQKALAVGPMPVGLEGVLGGKSAGEVAMACAKRAAAAGGAPATTLPIPSPSPIGGAASAAAAYVVYMIGIKDYGLDEGLWASVDFGNHWVPLAGPNSTTPEQGLGDTPSVLEPSLKEPGVLYVGTGGRGGYFRNVTEDLVKALLEC